MIAKGIEYEAVNYIQHPLSADELKQLLRTAGLKPQEVLRTKEAAYQQFVAGRELSDAQLIQVMTDHPELIQRPIVVRHGKAVLARPVAKLAELGIR